MDIGKIKKLSYEELLNYCKENDFNVLTKQKKNKTHKTLIKELTTLLNKKEMNDRVIETPEIINEIIWKLDDDKNNDNDEYLKNKTFMNTIISKAHQLLYSHSISGKKAQADIMKILSIISLNSLIKNENIDIDKLIQEKEIQIQDKEKLNLYKKYLLDLTKILESENIFNEWKRFILLFVSKLFPTIIDTTNDISFNITDEYAFRDLIKILCQINNNLNLSKDLSIICGDIYEYFLNYCGKGGGSKELGQFFTPRILIDIFLNVCGVKELITSYDNPKIYDCCMGSGGFLSRTYISNNINPENIYGNDYENDIYKIAQNSLTILTKLGNININKCNSLSSKNPYLMNNDLKFEVILTNPPFATEITLNKDDIKQIPNYNEIYPLEMKDGICMFIQMIIYKLKEGGICGIVLPDGKLLNNNQKTYIKIREYILKNARILKIVNAGNGIFENTGIKTSFILFQKGNYDNYNHKTEFYEILNKGKEVKFIGKSTLNKNLQFKFDYILNEEKIEYRSDIEIKTLGEICEFQNGYSFKSTDYEKQNETNIGILQIKSIKNSFIDENNITEYIKENKKYKLFEIQKGDILIALSGATIGKIGIYNLEYKSYLNQRIGKINAKTDINQKYIYYWYICCNINKKILNLAQGTAQPNISTNDILKIKIPIPSLEVQESLVEFLDNINEVKQDNINKIEKTIKNNKLYLELSLRLNKIEIKTLGDVCKVNQGTYIKHDMKIQGEYPVYGGGNISYYINQYNRENDIIIAKDGMSANCVRYEKNKFFLNHHGWTLNCNENINKKYIFYYLQFNQQQLLNIAKGTAQLGINQENFNNLKIPIPSLEVQNKIVEYIDNKNKIIKDLEKEIEDITNDAEEFMKNSLV